MRVQETKQAHRGVRAAKARESQLKQSGVRPGIARKEALSGGARGAKPSQKDKQKRRGGDKSGGCVCPPYCARIHDSKRRSSCQSSLLSVPTGTRPRAPASHSVFIKADALAADWGVHAHIVPQQNGSCKMHSPSCMHISRLVAASCLTACSL